MWDVRCWDALKCLGRYLRTHLFYRGIVLWLSRLIEIKDRVGAQADGADSWVVQWSIFMRLGRKRAPGLDRAGAGVGFPSWDREGVCSGSMRVGKPNGYPSS